MVSGVWAALTLLSTQTSATLKSIQTALAQSPAAGAGRQEAAAWLPGKRSRVSAGLPGPRSPLAASPGPAACERTTTPRRGRGGERGGVWWDLLTRVRGLCSQRKMALRTFGSGPRRLLALALLLLPLLLVLGPWQVVGHGGKYSREQNEPERPPKREPGGEFRMEKLNQLWGKAQRVSGRAGGAAGRVGPGSSGNCVCRLPRPSISVLPPCEVFQFLFGAYERLCGLGAFGVLRDPGSPRGWGRALRGASPALLRVTCSWGGRAPGSKILGAASSCRGFLSTLGDSNC